MRSRVVPITEADLDEVSTFLHRHMDGHVSVPAWRQSFGIGRRFDPPNHGMMLVAGDSLVGVHAAYYSERDFGKGRIERMCNLGSWFVLPQYRVQGARLLKALLDQPDLHFSDLTPTGNVVPINERLGFRFLDSRSVLVPTIPWGRRRNSVISDPDVLADGLDERERRIHDDHRQAAAARQVLLRDGSRSCYVVFRTERRTRLTGYVASILHVSDRAVFRSALRPFLGHLLLRHGAVAMLAEIRVIGFRPSGSLMLHDFRRKMFRSPTLGPGEIDYFYSELVAVPW